MSYADEQVIKMVSEGAPPVAGGATAAKCSGRQMARSAVDAGRCRVPQKENCSKRGTAEANSEDKQVIDMVNKPHERRKQLLARSRAAKRARQKNARKRARIAGAINYALWLVLKVELVALAAAVGFIIVAG